jgi:cobalt-precorrin-5B (C1)-methyltransferase
VEDYITVNGRRLRRGYTTGSCAAAAAKGAAALLLGLPACGFAEIPLPSGARLRLPLAECRMDGDGAVCGVVKDGGDDHDVTSGCLVRARVSRMGACGFVIEGGEGVGRVTLAGLDAPVGGPAINSVPRRMVGEALAEACEAAGYAGGLRAVLSIPDGERLAERTFNSRVGVAGGLSILGTTGIVEPASEAAFLGAVKAELSVLRGTGAEAVALAPGNIGLDFVARRYPAMRPVKCANFIGDSLGLAAELSFGRVLVAGHIGKLVKLVNGGFNTHSRYGDGRLPVFASFAAAEGAGRLLTAELLSCATSEAAIELLKGAGLLDAVMARVLEGTRRQLDGFIKRHGYRLTCEAAFFSSRYGFLGETGLSN